MIGSRDRRNGTLIECGVKDLNTLRLSGAVNAKFPIILYHRRREKISQSRSSSRETCTTSLLSLRQSVNDKRAYIWAPSPYIVHKVRV